MRILFLLIFILGQFQFLNAEDKPKEITKKLDLKISNEGLNTQSKDKPLDNDKPVSNKQSKPKNKSVTDNNLKSKDKSKGDDKDIDNNKLIIDNKTINKDDNLNKIKKTKFSSTVIFFIGISLLFLFIYYLFSESEKNKRIAGIILSVLVTAICVWMYSVLGMEKGIELQGGVSMEIKIIPNEGEEIGQESQEKVIEVMNERLNSLGTGEVSLIPTGKDGIFLQMPGVGNDKLEEIKKAIKKISKLEFSILHPQSQILAGQVVEGVRVVPGYEALPYKESYDEDGNLNPTRYALVKINRDMQGDHISKASYFYGESGPSINVSFTGDGSKIMGPLTRDNVNNPLAIILDNVIISSPVINEPFSTGCLITGQFTQKEAISLATSLQNPLKNPIEIQSSNFITPSMGKSVIKQGMLAGISGLIITLIFILIYYRFAGALALLGLCVSIAIIFGTMAMFQFTLTLPGIAGIILTIGVAIDANVLIYERLREEILDGKSLKTAVRISYEKAFSAIIDANITTLLTASILYVIASGTVKGFAVTLIIGIFATLFSSLIVTRVLFQLAINLNLIKKIKFLYLIPKKIIPFLNLRNKALIVSSILVISSIIAVLFIDPRGVELKGGDLLTIKSTEKINKSDIKKSLEGLDLKSKPIIQVQEPVGEKGKFYLIRSLSNKAEIIKSKIENDYKISLDDTIIRSVGSTIGKSMMITSIIALLLGVVAIFIYVTFRFEFSFALGAIGALFHDLILVAGILTVLGQEFNVITIGAFLTIAGYSINDTIVVFDRVRENLTMKRGEVSDIINLALNKTLSRTILTSATTLIIVLVLFLFGGPGLRSFSITLIVGVIVGTYSSLFIASPITYLWAKKTNTNLRRAVLDTQESRV